MRIFFYDVESIRREIGPHGEIELSEIDEEVWCAGLRGLTREALEAIPVPGSQPTGRGRRD